mgnify:CR=1 FL=1
MRPNALSDEMGVPPEHVEVPAGDAWVSVGVYPVEDGSETVGTSDTEARVTANYLNHLLETRPGIERVVGMDTTCRDGLSRAAQEPDTFILIVEPDSIEDVRAGLPEKKENTGESVTNDPERVLKPVEETAGMVTHASLASVLAAAAVVSLPFRIGVRAYRSVVDRESEPCE